MAKKTTLSSLIPDNKNNNKHTAYGMDLLEKSVNKVGIIESITVSNDDKIISGNARHEIIGKNFTKEAIVIETDGTQPIIIKRTDIESDTKQFYEASILANTTAKKNIDFDMEVIDILVDEFDIDVVDLGLDIIEEEVLEAEEDDFNGVPPKEPITVLGDLYEIGEHRLLCGDSTCSDTVEKLMNGKKIDVCFTSPPYNAGDNSGLVTGKKGSFSKNNFYENESQDSKTENEYVDFLNSFFNCILINCSTEYKIFININYNYNSPSSYIKFVNNCLEKTNLKETIIWKKSSAMPIPLGLTRLTEFIFLFSHTTKNDFIQESKKDTLFNFYEIKNGGSQIKGHNAAFPIELPFELIKIVKGNNIYEPFCGTGSTMVASNQLNRKCYGMELDPKYCDVIVARMIKLDSTLPIKRNGVLLTNSEVLKFTENTSESN